MSTHASFFLDGAWVPVDREALTVVNPETEEPVGSVPAGRPEDVDVAVAAARRAFPGWSTTSTVDRAAILSATADALEARRVENARLISTEMGTPLDFSQAVRV